MEVSLFFIIIEYFSQKNLKRASPICTPCRRLQVMPFTTLFTDFVEQRSRTYTEGLVFAKDPALKARLPLLRDAATTILVDICLKTKGVVMTCDKIEKLTNEYRLTQDRVAYFIDSRIEKKEGNHLPITTLRAAMKDWHRMGTEAPLDLNMVIDRLMRDPYGYAFNAKRNLGFGFAIRSEIFVEGTAAVAETRPVSVEEEFITAFATCHTFTGVETDFVPCRDVATWAAHNGMRLQNSQKMLELVRQMHTDIIRQGRRIPKRNGSTGTETRDCFFKLKRIMWRADGVAPAPLNDANSSFGSDTTETKEEVVSDISF